MQPYVTAWIGEVWFGLPASVTREVTSVSRPRPVPLAPRGVCGLLNLRGEVVPIIDLPLLLGGPAHDPRHRRPSIIVVHGDGVWSVLIDRIGDVLSLDPERIEPVPAHVDADLRGVLAGTCQHGAQLIQILDLTAVLASAGRGADDTGA